MLTDTECEVADCGEILSDIKSPQLTLDSVGVCSSVKDIFSTKREAWNKDVEARCDFAHRPRLVHRNGLFFISLWQKSVYGRTLTDIKNDDDMIQFFAENISKYISSVIGNNLSQGDWCICTTPKRRHKERNFASRIAHQIGLKLSIPFIEDVAYCRTKQRINAVFDLNILPTMQNVIVFDDFATTGSTLGAMRNLLTPHGKNLLFVAGINNSL